RLRGRGFRHGRLGWGAGGRLVPLRVSHTPIVRGWVDSRRSKSHGPANRPAERDHIATRGAQVRRRPLVDTETTQRLGDLTGPVRGQAEPSPGDVDQLVE